MALFLCPGLLRGKRKEVEGNKREGKRYFFRGTGQ
jgi:hypothetical protein